MSNNDCRGSFNTNSARLYLKNSSGQDIVFNKGQWYRVVLQMRFDHTTAAQGRVLAWIDNSATAAVDWTGRVGYTPEALGGQAGTLSATAVSIGLYQQDSLTNHRVFFDRIKFTDTKAEALPY